MYLESSDSRDMVVMNPRWLCGELIGKLLSQEQILHSRPTGCFTVDDFQFMFSESQSQDVLNILDSLETCTQCDIDGEVEYEFPCLNFVETLHGLWEKDISRYSNAVYSGVRIQCRRAVTNQLVHVFPRVQVQLRRNFLKEHNLPDSDLYQWHHGSKFCAGILECLITMAQHEEVIEIKVRGPEELRTALYYFLEDMQSTVEQVLEDCMPGAGMERHYLSPSHLREHHLPVKVYSPSDMILRQLDNQSNIPLDDDKAEEFLDILCSGSDEVFNQCTIGVDLHISHLSIHTRRMISALLDPPESMGRDWCLLAVSLGLSDNLPHLDTIKQYEYSRTDRTLEIWSQDTEATIRVLINKLKELGRNDAADMVIHGAPVFHVFKDDNASQAEGESAQAPSHSSDNTLSSVSR